MFPDLYIRVDAGPLSGFGHFTRCMALAHMLSHEDRKIFFASIELDAVCKEEIVNAGFTPITIEENQAFLQFPKKGDIVVLDGYDFDDTYCQKIKNNGCFLVIINDIPTFPLTANLIINHTPGISIKDYVVANETQFALGLDYVLLRPAFLKAAEEKTYKKVKPLHKVLVCFGGSDPNNLTQRTLQLLTKRNEFEEIDVVLGNGYRHWDSISAINAEDGRIRLYQGLDESKMIELMQQAYIAVVPCSVTLFEVLAVGNLIVSGYYVDNQRLVYQNLRDTAVFIDAGDFSSEILASAIDEAIENQGKHSHTSLIDGRSGQRISVVINRLSIQSFIHLRLATVQDVIITYEWAQNPSVRQYSFSKDKIQWEEHKNWFNGKLEDTNTIFLIAEYKNIPVGSVRFDTTNADAIVSYLVNPMFHGLGLGTLLLVQGMAYLKKHSSAKKVLGFVMPDNSRSLAIFRKLYFQEEQLTDRIKFQFCI